MREGVEATKTRPDIATLPVLRSTPFHCAPVSHELATVCVTVTQEDDCWGEDEVDAKEGEGDDVVEDDEDAEAADADDADATDGDEAHAWSQGAVLRVSFGSPLVMMPTPVYEAPGWRVAQLVTENPFLSGLTSTFHDWMIFTPDAPILT